MESERLTESPAGRTAPPLAQPQQRKRQQPPRPFVVVVALPSVWLWFDFVQSPVFDSSCEEHLRRVVLGEAPCPQPMRVVVAAAAAAVVAAAFPLVVPLHYHSLSVDPRLVAWPLQSPRCPRQHPAYHPLASFSPSPLDPRLAPLLWWCSYWQLSPQPTQRLAQPPWLRRSVEPVCTPLGGTFAVAVVVVATTPHLAPVGLSQLPRQLLYFACVLPVLAFAFAVPATPAAVAVDET